VNAYAAGGQTDIAVRLTADRLSAAIGQRVVVETRVGGATSIASTAVEWTDSSSFWREGQVLLGCFMLEALIQHSGAEKRGPYMAWIYRFGSFTRVLAAPQRELLKMRGLGHHAPSCPQTGKERLAGSGSWRTNSDAPAMSL
jgi:hypothetical protein